MIAAFIKDADISCDALTQLRSVGSNLKHEFDVTHGIIIRSRLYALNPLSNNPATRHIARHSVHMPESDFLSRIRHAYLTKTLSDLDYKTTRLIKLDESIRLGKPLNSSYTYEGRINLGWDAKRQLLTPVDNPFATGSFTKPLSNINHNKARKTLTNKPTTLKQGRKPRIDKNAILSLRDSGYSLSQISKQLQVSKTYISQVLKQIKVLKE